MKIGFQIIHCWHSGRWRCDQARCWWIDSKALKTQRWGKVLLTYGKVILLPRIQGNSGDRGRLLVTNLRVIWHSASMPRVSLCKSLRIVGFWFLNLLFGTFRFASHLELMLLTYNKSPQLLVTAVSWTSQQKRWTPNYADSPRPSTCSPSVTTQGK